MAFHNELINNFSLQPTVQLCRKFVGFFTPLHQPRLIIVSIKNNSREWVDNDIVLWPSAVSNVKINIKLKISTQKIKKVIWHMMAGKMMWLILFIYLFLIWHNFMRNANVAVDEALLKWWLMDMCWVGKL